MGFTEAVRTCLSNYATFSGRARRPEYWWFFLFVVLGGILASLLDGLLFGFGPPGEPETQVLSPLFTLAMALPLLAAGWRRMHDSGRPGWYLLVPMLISFAMLFLIVFELAARSALVGPGPAAGGPGLGAVLIAALLIAQTVSSLLILWWLTRPTQTGRNAFGREPRVGARGERGA